MATAKKTTSTKAAKTEEAKVSEDTKKVLSDQDVEVIKPQPIVTEVKDTKKTTKTAASKKTAAKTEEAKEEVAKEEETKEDTTMEKNVNINEFDEEKFAMDVLESFNKFNTVLETMSNNIASYQSDMKVLQKKVDANEKNIKIISKYLADKEKEELEAEANAEVEAKETTAEEGATEEGKKKWSTKKKVAVGVGIGVGVLAVAGVSYAIYKHNKNKNDYADDDAVAYIDAPSDEDDDTVITEI